MSFMFLPYDDSALQAAIDAKQNPIVILDSKINLVSTIGTSISMTSMTHAQLSSASHALLELIAVSHNTGAVAGGRGTGVYVGNGDSTDAGSNLQLIAPLVYTDGASEINNNRESRLAMVELSAAKHFRYRVDCDATISSSQGTINLVGYIPQ